MSKKGQCPGCPVRAMLKLLRAQTAYINVQRDIDAQRRTQTVHNATLVRWREANSQLLDAEAEFSELFPAGVLKTLEHAVRVIDISEIAKEVLGDLDPVGGGHAS